MEKLIKELPYTDESTKVMLQDLFEKKVKFDTAENNHRLHVFISFGLAIILLYNIYQSIKYMNNLQLDILEMIFSQNHLNLIILVLLILDFAWLKVAKGKLTKLETEFHQLRIEIADKSKDLWRSDEAWTGRSHVFSVFKDNYDINLYYESK
jgi:hypothetical protein